MGKEKGDYSEKYKTLLKVVAEQDDIEQWLAFGGEVDSFYLYHLSEIRQNVISWLPLEVTSSVLELGAECGSITEFLCDKFERVVAIEPSDIKCRINKERNRDAQNLLIKTEELSSYVPDEKFDLVTLIGTKALADEKDFCRILNTAYQALHEDGVLFLAFDNKYGLEYFSGMKADNDYNCFEAITGTHDSYLGTYTSVKRAILQQKFKNVDVYIPYPDYKLPLEIYSEKNVPNNLYKGNTTAYQEARVVFFDESKVANNMIEEDMYRFFANSYVMICRK